MNVSAPDLKDILYRPSLFGLGRLHFVNTQARIDLGETSALLTPLSSDETRISWDEATTYKEDSLALEKEGYMQARFSPLPAAAARVASYANWKKELGDYLYQNKTLKLWESVSLKEISILEKARENSGPV